MSNQCETCGDIGEFNEPRCPYCSRQTPKRLNAWVGLGLLAVALLVYGAFMLGRL